VSSKSYKRIFIYILALLMPITGITSVLYADDAGAASHINRRFFMNTTVPAGDVGRLACRVFDTGLPSHARNKAGFISYVKRALNREISSPYLGRCGQNSGGHNATLYSIGAAYIIQTMRGENAGARWPTPADVADWEARINDPAITMHQEMYSYSQNTAFYWTSTPGNGRPSNGLDVYQYNDSGRDESTIFRLNYVNASNPGEIVYVVKNACANPLGQLRGPPSANFNLEPTITGTPSSVEENTSIQLNSTVNNGGTTPSAVAQWRVVTFSLRPGVSVPNGATNGTVPESFFRVDGINASVISGGSGSRIFPVSPRLTTLSVPDPATGTLQAGSKVCYALSVQPVTHASSNWRHSDPFCVAVGKKPKVQIWGGDLRVKSPTGVSYNAITGLSARTLGNGTQAVYGSWVEYGVFATGYVSGVSSASGLNTLDGAVNDQSLWSRLTFSNSHNSSTSEPCASGAIKFGCFRFANNELSTIQSTFPVSSTTPRISGTIANIASLANVSTVQGSSVTLAGGQLGPGQWRVINAPNATVNITGNINYTNQILRSTRDIPQMVIIARDINIAGNVSQVDSWLIASNSLVTCSDRGTAAQLNGLPNPANLPDQYKLTLDHCNNTLVINGHVATSKLWLRRTAGGSGSSGANGEPAEIINLRPDAHIWLLERSRASQTARPVFLTEQPPLF
jgi:hypothetical protein